ncbi:MAG: baseplate J/ family protein [Burkholderiaceae bacterium]|nr:baseplate J/ family protein [Burkholderiaceae bacterium]
MSTLPQFVSEDSQAITQELITAYEAMTGKTLYPAQVERLLIDLMAYRETLVRAAINDTARQNLVSFSRAAILDYLGELVGVTRLAAKYASTTVRLTFADALDTTLTIAAGTRVETAGGIQFQTESETIVAIGAVTADLSVSAVEAGTSGNGYLAGQVNALVDDFGVDVEAVANLSVTSGGADEESDDRLRERIKLAPEAYSTAGSVLAYRFHAMSAHQNIVDVAVLSSTPGTVQLYPLTSDGLPSEAIISAVDEICSSEKKRPLSDNVDVLQPIESAYTISARLTVYRSYDSATVLANAQAQAASFVATQSAALGRDVVPSQISAALSVAGVYEVVLLSPSATLPVAENGWAHCTAIDIQLAGGNDG